jgi:hypothetical protein
MIDRRRAAGLGRAAAHPLPGRPRSKPGRCHLLIGRRLIVLVVRRGRRGLLAAPARNPTSAKRNEHGAATAPALRQ